MKYTRLSKEQLEELHQEFANFLATQQITSDEWSNIKINKPDVAEEELDVFSDLVWEGVLSKVNFLEHFSKNQIHLFRLTPEKMYLIAIKVSEVSVDLLTKDGYKWLQENLMNDDVQFFNAEKEYSDDKNLDIFKIIQQGASITKGELYNYFENLLSGIEKNKIK